MMWTHRLVAAVIATLLATATSCSKSSPPTPPAGQKMLVAVSILPQAYFAQRIGGEHVALEVLVGPGQNPHAYEPTVRQMTELSQAHLLLTIGVPFEDALTPRLKEVCPALKIVPAQQGIERVPMGEVDHDADHGHAMKADDPDPHIWLSPVLAKQIAANICEAFCQADAVHAEDYRRNLQSLLADLDNLDAELAKALEPLAGRTIYVFHPAFGYFARRYGLKQRAVEIEGKSPGPQQLQALIDQARADGVKVIFVQPQFSDQAARAVAEQIGGAVVPMDDLAKDYLASLRDAAEKIRQALARR